MISLHVPVLLHQSVELLELEAGKTFFDGTLGGGGHSAFVAERFGKSVKIVGIDRDPAAVGRATERLRALGADFTSRIKSFRYLDEVLDELGIAKVDAILLDLGLSSDQLAEEGLPAGRQGRGFSFQRDEPLDMRMSGTGPTAADILNSWDEPAIELILRGFGEEKHARRIAERIVERRKTKPFATTFDLVEVVGKRSGKIHPATKTFQALRIAVNDELQELEAALTKGFDRLSRSGRFAIISFHSLEDRMVKNFFRERAKAGEGKLITKKPITPGGEETRANPRSRSAKLRVIEKGS